MKTIARYDQGREDDVMIVRRSSSGQPADAFNNSKPRLSDHSSQRLTNWPNFSINPDRFKPKMVTRPRNRSLPYGGISRCAVEYRDKEN
jgi:hypothetical protein